MAAERSNACAIRCDHCRRRAHPKADAGYQQQQAFPYARVADCAVTAWCITKNGKAVKRVSSECDTPTSSYNDKGVHPLSIQTLLRFSAHVQMLPILESGEETLVGGQAVMEGVMMRSPHSYCVAVRKANGDVVTEQHAQPKASDIYPIFKLPVLRGLGTLGQAMWLGIKALQFSTNVLLQQEPKSEGASPASEKPAELSPWMMGVTLGFSLLFFLFMYKFVPLVLATQLGHAFPALHGRLAINLMA